MSPGAKCNIYIVLSAKKTKHWWLAWLWLKLGGRKGNLLFIIIYFPPIPDKVNRAWYPTEKKKYYSLNSNPMQHQFYLRLFWLQHYFRLFSIPIYLCFSLIPPKACVLGGTPMCACTWYVYASSRCSLKGMYKAETKSSAKKCFSFQNSQDRHIWNTQKRVNMHE